jgi:hypothetical protein
VADVAGLGVAAGLRDPPGFGGAAGLEDSGGLAEASCEMVCFGADISRARSSKLPVISAHLYTGTDRAVSSGGCGADGDVEAGEGCGEILTGAALAFRVFGSKATSECADGSTASIGWIASGKGASSAGLP